MCAFAVMPTWWEMPDFGGCEVLTKHFGCSSQEAVGYQGEAIDLLAVFSYEVQVGSEPTKVFPSGKAFCLNHHTV